jgi:hypothetical protein
MSLKEGEDIRKVVDVKLVARLTKQIGCFALHEQSSENLLLITTNFILNLNPSQFWKVQCQLEAKRLGLWYQFANKDLLESKPVEEKDIALYFDILKRPREILSASNLCIVDASDILLYQNADSQYVGINREYIEMFDDVPAVAGISPTSPLIVSDMHVVMPVNLENGNYSALNLLNK